jgi:hypothetical protein
MTASLQVHRQRICDMANQSAVVVYLLPNNYYSVFPAKSDGDSSRADYFKHKRAHIRTSPQFNCANFDQCGFRKSEMQK